MATVAVNTPENIQFVNAEAVPVKNAPTLMVQSGDWQIGPHVEPGVVFDVSGDEAPMLTANDVRKLAKWLNRAADNLDGLKNSEKKRKTRQHYESDDEEDFERY